MGKGGKTFHWSLVDSSAGTDRCWPWTGPVNTWGYGDATLGGKRLNASRAAFLTYHGRIDEGLVVCHRCDNPICCNPEHLYAATQAENLADCRRKGRQRYRTGASHHRVGAKLTPELVKQARELYAQGITQVEIGKRFGVHSSVISRAVRGEYWSHVA